MPEKDIIQVYTSAILPTLPEVDEEDDSDDHNEATYCNKKMDIYLNYFESTWLGAVNKRTQIRGKPKFAMKYWVKYNAVLEGREDFTNNHSEAWNSARNVSIPLKPNLWVVCKAIQQDEGLTRAKLQRALSGSPPLDCNPKR